MADIFLLRCCLKSIENNFQVVFYRKENQVYDSNHSLTRYLNLYGTVDRPLPPTHFWNPNTRRRSSVGSMPALYANSPNIEPRVRLPSIFPLTLILEKQAVYYWPNEWTLDCSKLPTGDLPRNSVVK